MISGKYYRVNKIAENATSVKLVCFGILPGKVVQIVRKAPFGGAYYISCDDKRIGLSAQELERLDLTEIQMDENRLP